MRTQNIGDIRFFHRMHGRGYLSDFFTNGKEIVSGTLKNLGSSALPVIKDFLKETGKEVINKIKEEAPKYIENKTREFVTDVLSSDDKKQAVRNFGKNTGNQLKNNFKKDLKNIVESKKTQDAIDEITKSTKRELNSSASSILNNLLSGRGLAEPKTVRKKGQKGTGMIPIYQ